MADQPQSRYSLEMRSSDIVLLLSGEPLCTFTTHGPCKKNIYVVTATDNTTGRTGVIDADIGSNETLSLAHFHAAKTAKGFDPNYIDNTHFAKLTLEQTAVQTPAPPLNDGDMGYDPFDDYDD